MLDFLFDFLKTFGFVVSGVMVITSLFGFLKVKNTVKQRKRIHKAIFKYQMRYVANEATVTVFFDDMEEYEKTLYRFWDWSCKRILPPEKFKIIEPFIER